MENLGIHVEREGWKKYICERIQESGKRVWKDGFNDTVCTNERKAKKWKFCRWKCARVRLMVRGGCLPIRGSERMT